jgi:prevent-host-death family protein
MPKPVSIYDAKTHFSRLVERVEAGEEVVITRSGRPVARLVPLRPATKRAPGRWRGKIRIAADFDAPLPDSVLAEFEGESD